MNPDKIRVVVVDDHPMVRGGLAGVIKSEHGLELVGEASTGQQAVLLCANTPSDVVLMDLMMPELDGISATAQIKQLVPSVQVIVLSSFLEPDLVQSALRAGAIGYLLKTASAAQITDAVRAAHARQRTLDPQATNALIEATQHQGLGPNLTERELGVLRLMAEGCNNQEIGARLQVSLPTVKFHVSNILGKLQVGSRTEAVVQANRLKILR